MTSTKNPWLGCGMLVLIWLYCAAHADDPVCRFGVAWLMIVGILFGVVALFRRRGGGARPPSGRAASGAVAICVSGALMPVPSLKYAYLSMPDHCRAVLGL